MPRVWEIITIGGTESLWIRFLLKSMRGLRVVLLGHYWLATDRRFLCFSAAVSPFLHMQFSLSCPFLVLLALKENGFWKFKSMDSSWKKQSGTRSVRFLFRSQLECLGAITTVRSRPFVGRGELPPPETLSAIHTHEGRSYKPGVNPAPQKNENIRSVLSIGAGEKSIWFWIQLTMPGCLQRRSISHPETLDLNVKCFFY